MTRITMLGSGLMASALSVPLADNGHEVRLVGTHLDREIIDRVTEDRVHPGLNRALPATVQAFQVESLAEAISGAEIVLSGVNSFGVRWAGEQLAPLLNPDMLVIAIAKGMDATEDGDLRILPDVLSQYVSPEMREQIAWSAIVGPSIAGEVAARRDTCVLFAGTQKAALEQLAHTFRTEHYHVWTSLDLVGAEVCAALKNCYALGVGLAEGVLEQLGETGSEDRNHNYEAALFAQGAIEIAQMVRLLDGREEPPHALPSVGDMYVTSAGGRNVRVGRLMGTGLRFSEAREKLGNPTLEGAAAIQVAGEALLKLTERNVVAAADFPLLRHLYEIVALEQPVNVPWSRFFGGER